MSFNPYETLGVEKDADLTTIKRAHRRRAKETHPDKPGGTAEEFHKVARALVILKDPVKRAQFDRDGVVDDRPDNDEAVATGLVAGAICAAVDQLGDKLDQLDILDLARNNFEQHIAGYKEQRAGFERKIKQLERAIKRLKKKKGGDSFLHRALQGAADALRPLMLEADTRIRHNDLALKLLKEFTYEFDAPPPAPSLAKGFGFSEAMFDQMLRDIRRGS